MFSIFVLVCKSAFHTSGRGLVKDENCVSGETGVTALRGDDGQLAVWKDEALFITCYYFLLARCFAVSINLTTILKKGTKKIQDQVG